MKQYLQLLKGLRAATKAKIITMILVLTSIAGLITYLIMHPCPLTGGWSIGLIVWMWAVALVNKLSKPLMTPMLMRWFQEDMTQAK